MRQLLLSLWTFAASEVVAQEKAIEVTEAEVAFYQLGIETGCKDAGRRRGDPAEQVEGFCNCLMSLLKAELTFEEWQQASLFSRNRQEREEMEILRPHMAGIQECRNAS